MGDWVLYAAAIVGAWSMAEAVMRLVDAVDKRKTAFRVEPKSGQCRSNLPNENTIIVAEKH